MIIIHAWFSMASPSQSHAPKGLSCSSPLSCYLKDHNCQHVQILSSRSISALKCYIHFFNIFNTQRVYFCPYSHYVAFSVFWIPIKLRPPLQVLISFPYIVRFPLVDRSIGKVYITQKLRLFYHHFS